MTIKHAPVLQDFCEAANDLYAEPTEAHFYAVVNLARELIAQASVRWDEGYQFALSQYEKEPVAWLTPTDRTPGYPQGHETCQPTDYGAFPVYRKASATQEGIPL